MVSPFILSSIVVGDGYDMNLTFPSVHVFVPHRPMSRPVTPDDKVVLLTQWEEHIGENTNRRLCPAVDLCLVKKDQ